MAKQNIRRLAAIMFTDMVGYTAMMQEDEAFANDKKNIFKTSVQKHVGDHRGTVIQYYGDGILSMFDSAYEAVQSAIKIQTDLIKSKVPLRIGLHSGDIVYDGEGAFGDGVNVASRIESLAVPGSVLISDKIYDDIKNQKEVLAKSLGIFEFKNVKRPTEVFAVLNNNMVLPDGKEMKGKVVESTNNTIAVLPFVNMSNDVENEYFSDGITEEVINALVKIPDVKVTSRTSSFKFKGQNDDIREIGEQLGVSRVLEGSVRKAGNKVRITAQLIKASDGYHEWSEVYDRDLNDVFAVQDEISQNISNQLRQTITKQKNFPDIDSQSNENRPTNGDAYNLYLKGLFHFKKNTPNDSKVAIGYLEEAIAMDDKFAAAYSSLAFCYTVMAGYGQMNAEAGYDKAKEASNRALELDPDSAEALCSLGLISLIHEWDFKGAKKAFERAIEIRPNDFEVLHALSFYYYAIGEHEKNLENMKRAYLIDPLSIRTNKALGDAYLACQMYERAYEQYDKVIEIDPSFRAALEAKGRGLLEEERFEEALEVLKDYRRQINDPLKGNPQLVYVYYKLGNKAKAEEHFKLLEQRKQKEPDINLDFDFVMAYLGLEDYEKAIDIIEGTMSNRSAALLFMNNSPVMNPLKNNPRYISLLKSAGIDKLRSN